MKKKSKKKKVKAKPMNMKSKMIAALVVLVVLIAGVSITHHYLWWFSPAQSQRQLLADFYSDLSTGNVGGAYKLTSSDFQAKNGLNGFEGNLDSITGKSLGINYISYTVSGSTASVLGTVTSKSTQTTINFGASIVKQDGNLKIDVLVLKINS